MNNTYSFVTNVTLYDYREGKPVQAVQLNVANLNAWLGKSTGAAYEQRDDSPHSGHGINSVYIYNNNPLTSSSLPAVQVYQGSQLPTAGLTVVTPDPFMCGATTTQTGPALGHGERGQHRAGGADRRFDYSFVRQLD